MWRLALILVGLQVGVMLLGIDYEEVSAAQADAARITGTYSDIRYIEEAGDVVGTEIAISFSGGTYKGTVQIAEGVPSTPIPVSIQVNGKRITFSIPDPSPFAGRFNGEIKRGILRGKFSFKNGATERVSLPRKSDPKQTELSEPRMFEACCG